MELSILSQKFVIRELLLHLNFIFLALMLSILYSILVWGLVSRDLIIVPGYLELPQRGTTRGYKTSFQEGGRAKLMHEPLYHVIGLLKSREQIDRQSSLAGGFKLRRKATQASLFN